MSNASKRTRSTSSDSETETTKRQKKEDEGEEDDNIEFALEKAEETLKNQSIDKIQKKWITDHTNLYSVVRQDQLPKDLQGVKFYERSLMVDIELSKTDGIALWITKSLAKYGYFISSIPSSLSERFFDSLKKFPKQKEYYEKLQYISPTIADYLPVEFFAFKWNSEKEFNSQKLFDEGVWVYLVEPLEFPIVEGQSDSSSEDESNSSSDSESEDESNTELRKNSNPPPSPEV